MLKLEFCQLTNWYFVVTYITGEIWWNHEQGEEKGWSRDAANYRPNWPVKRVHRLVEESSKFTPVNSTSRGMNLCYLLVQSWADFWQALLTLSWFHAVKESCLMARRVHQQFSQGIAWKNYSIPVTSFNLISLHILFTKSFGTCTGFTQYFLIIQCGRTYRKFQAAPC